GWRPIQEQALDFICDSLAEGADDIMVEAPTGVGKSPVAIALARSAAAVGASTCISTKDINLEKQYMRDFRRLGLKQLHAKKHYNCPDRGTCDVGTRCNCSAKGSCTYQVAKARFIAANFSIANASFLTTCARFCPMWWAPRGIAIFDEAHT